MISVAILCTECGERLTVPGAADGKKGKCPCGAVFAIDLLDMEAPPLASGPFHSTRSPQVYGPPEGVLIEEGLSADDLTRAIGDGFTAAAPEAGVMLLCYYDLGLAFRFAAGALHSIYLYTKNPYGFENYLGVIYKGLSTQSMQGDINLILGEPEHTRSQGDGTLAPQTELAYPTMGLIFNVRGADPLAASARVRHVIVTRPIRLITTPPIAMA